MSIEVRDPRHALLPETSTEERSRQKAVVTLRRLLNSRVRSRNVAAYEEEGKPAFQAKFGHAPRTEAEIWDAYMLSPAFRRWSAVNRSVQEMLWIAVGEPIYRDRERLQQTARKLMQAPGRKGSLSLDPAYAPSLEVADIDIHLQPGGYAMDLGEYDVTAGALYENGGNVFAFGQGLVSRDSKAWVIIRLLEEQYGGFVPARILEMGCSSGTASATYALHYPDAEVHAIDIGASMLRYAHARAEALGAAVHFHQMDARHVAFEDASFDLVVSNNMMHEISNATRRQVMEESWRLVRPGGVVIHQDVGILRFQPSLEHQVEMDWDRHFNGERHWHDYATGDIRADMLAAGFPEGSLKEQKLASVGKSGGGWYIISARKPA